MKNVLLAAAAACVAASVVRAATEEKFLVVKVLGRAKETTCQVMTPEEFKALQEDIRAETRVFPKALLEAQKSWREDEDTARKPFPKSSFTVRRATSMGMFADREKAEAKVEAFEIRERDTMDRDKEREDKKARDKEKSVGSERYEEEAEREREKQTERDALMLRARDVLEQKLSDLIGVSGAAEEPASETAGDTDKEASDPAPAADPKAKPAAGAPKAKPGAGDDAAE